MLKIKTLPINTLDQWECSILLGLDRWDKRHMTDDEMSLIQITRHSRLDRLS